ncbi:ribosomal protein S18 acetylase RimI-like enzyme [Paenibacillus sp. V4I3]|uniref:GNAT family N-acetyltransferase n=1 Tax=unclassified Paenibacillus TaxID=185978 RepID=UPI0027837B56|nr:MULTISPECIES: GNAT family N-acetyltransferase [unclassified Paenibacillus]MDQ0874614.1 ribosomal protein S18 acetylase RimI-like enzyme [Paenibacillus sp. V4I3]MDQ0889634.1 ribosomal protein S18 acetylase RimI-like enzyme [Paenibacillus sp. V4I9]
MVVVRLLEQKEYDFFMDMHYESIYILEDKPSKYELLNAPNIKKYSEEWGRKGDKALVALIDDKPIGAVWYRLFDETNKGYGYVDNNTPELGIALLPDFKQKGIGTILMKEINQQARIDGYKSLSLSVDPDNHIAVRLYEKLGFEYFGMSGTSWIMKITF